MDILASKINEFFSLLSLEAQLQHGALHEWYGERVTSTLFKGGCSTTGCARARCKPSSSSTSTTSAAA